MKTCLQLSIIVSCLFLSCFARAESPVVSGSPSSSPPPSAPSRETPPTEGGATASQTAPSTKKYYQWYGWQTLISDAASLSLFIAAAKTDDLDTRGGLVTASVGTFALGPPIIHLMHGQPLRSLGSFALRVGPPIAAVALFADGMDGNHSDGVAHLEIVSGILIATLFVPTAIVLDSAALAYKEVPPPNQAVRFAPTIVPIQSGSLVGVQGIFW